MIPGSVFHFGPERPQLHVLPIRMPRWRLPIAIMTLKNRTLSPAAQLFIKTAREVAKRLAPSSGRMG
jgi:DNA-binding transcriptional LysR family regulator